MTHLVHQLIDDHLETHGLLKLVPREGRGEEHEGGEVEGVPVKLILPPHADSLKFLHVFLSLLTFCSLTVHETVVLRFLNEVCQGLLVQGERHTGVHDPGFGHFQDYM